MKNISLIIKKDTGPVLELVLSIWVCLIVFLNIPTCLCSKYWSFDVAMQLVLSGICIAAPVFLYRNRKTEGALQFLDNELLILDSTKNVLHKIKRNQLRAVHVKLSLWTTHFGWNDQHVNIYENNKFIANYHTNQINSYKLVSLLKQNQVPVEWRTEVSFQRNFVNVLVVILVIGITIYLFPILIAAEGYLKHLPC